MGDAKTEACTATEEKCAAKGAAKSETKEEIAKASMNEEKPISGSERDGAPNSDEGISSESLSEDDAGSSMEER